ncbi:MAG: hypothetical protein JWM81_169 [Candidatus Saccharibacteria bacterium]|nr:hypothetical protein [Candidatus Saccharibacteria bacterium]
MQFNEQSGQVIDLLARESEQAKQQRAEQDFLQDMTANPHTEQSEAFFASQNPVTGARPELAAPGQTAAAQAEVARYLAMKRALKAGQPLPASAEPPLAPVTPTAEVTPAKIIDETEARARLYTRSPISSISQKLFGIRPH